MTSQDWFTKDFYATLGVPKDADEATIKKAYRKLARALHPDANPDDPTAEGKFKEIGEAYAVLSDKKQREQYDSVRAMGGGARFQPGQGGGFEDAFSGMFAGGDVSGLFGNLFGGGGFSMGPRPGVDLAAATEVSFRDAASGATLRLNVGGSPISTRLPAGVSDGQRIRLKGKGQKSPNGGPAGDLVITVHVKAHPVFTAEGTNLRMRLPVTFDEAALGAEVVVPTLEGSTVTVKVPAGTSSGTVLRVKGRGIATSSRTGDLLATVEVHVPAKLTSEARRAVEALREATKQGDVRADLYKGAST